MEQRLYQWQEECLDRWLENDARGIVQAVTGSGKTRLALCAMDALERKLGRKVLVKIVVPTSSLMRQWAKALREHREASGADKGVLERDVSDKSLSEKNASEKSDSGKNSPQNRISDMHVLQKRIVQNKIGLHGGGRKDPDDARYMIYVINSARYELARQILTQLKSGEAVLLIADECHHYTSRENYLIFEFLDRIDKDKSDYYSLGLSATLPSGKERHMLEKALGSCIYSYGMSKALAMKTVCPFDVFHIALTFQEEELDEYEELTTEMTYCHKQLVQKVPSLGKLNRRELFEELRRLSSVKNAKIARLASTYLNLTYKRRILVCLAASRISCAENLVLRLDPKERILVFGERIDQAEELYGILYRHYPGRVGRCHSKMGEQANRMNLERFRTGEYRILITCKSMDEGVDIPDASVGIILSGTSMQRQRMQRLGRIIRRGHGKERAALYYLHVEESSEDNCYLPEVWESRTFELEYDFDRQNFTQPAYDEAAWMALEDIRRSGVSEKTLQEAWRCLDLGRVRGDWMEEPDTYESRIRSAEQTEERNYWICMKKAAAFRL
ncbi:MAG: DEAD/DEAH box helicase family protein [Lachnospiraceae bacterium]|nr:DEAD/DEAH box helicase family protein [Lachnospiraceae bacterium]